MQVLYAMNRDKALTPERALTQYNHHIGQAYHLYLFNLYHLIKVADYAKFVQKKKREKLRPTPEDLAFRPKLAENDLIRSLHENKGLQSEFRFHKIPDKLSEDTSRLVYKKLESTEEYQAYLKNDNLSNLDHQKILLLLFKTMINHEVFEDILDENYLFWEDDKSLVVGAMKKTIKALPNDGAFYNAYQPSTDTVKDFGEVLLNKVFADGQALFDIIEPTLKNWDAERVAVIDMILLKMAVCELMNFPTIPTKVTLNEFVEISKLYSTDKSKDFINGILDRLLKKLEKDGRVIKEGRGLIQ